jgi:cysteine desulfurase family protein (TIGR01976 family)
MPNLDVAALRAQFPALALEHAGRPMAFFDGPGGTQVPESVIAAVADYYRTANANDGGPFATSERSMAISAEAHRAVADLIGADDAESIAFGPNMTTLTFHLSRSITATMALGDEIIVTGLDHQANVDPWIAAATDRGLTVRIWEPRLEDATLQLEDLDALLSPRTQLLALGLASNAVGTINPVAEAAARIHAAGGLVYVDAVHAAPHLPIDVAALGVDFLVCSAYKFFGPHQGMAWGRPELLESLPAYKVRPAHHRFETGTQSFESQAGTLAAIEYLAGIGRSAGEVEPGAGRRAALVAGLGAIREAELATYAGLAVGLATIPGLRSYGLTDPATFERRAPTAAFTIAGTSPRAVAEALGAAGIAVWDGDFYATGLIERLGLAESGGVVRVGLMHYNTAQEVDRLVAALGRIAEGATRSGSGAATAAATSGSGVAAGRLASGPA